MKRNMDLIRKILLKVEEEHDGMSTIQITSVEHYPSAEVCIHEGLLLQAGYLEGGTDQALQDVSHRIRGLTWEGHDFLDSVRSERVWNRVVESLKAVGGQASVVLTKQLAIEIAKAYIKLSGLS